MTLIDRYLAGSTTASQEQQLHAFLDSFQVEDALAGAKDAETEERMLLGIWERIANENSGPGKVRRFFSGWVKYAAAAIIILCAGAYLWNNYKTHPKENTATITPSSPDILPGGQRAILTLADGREIILDSAANGQLAVENGSKIIKRGDEIIYGSPPILSPSEAPKERRAYSAKASQAEAYNTMSTPRGGQYQLTLSDGTKVWLNAASQITYPTRFVGKTREVKVEGEVYFEIKPNKNQPFIVKTTSDEIEVLGTEFNVNNYPDEPASKISLISGAVRVKPSFALRASEGEGKLLQPGQAYVNGKIIQTNIQQDIAWRNGIFNFNGTDFPGVMRQLERWYDIQVEYKNEVPSLRLRGEMQRELTLQQVLELLDEMHVKFKIEGKTLFVE